MKILALELSTARGSLAWLDGEVEFAREWPNDRKNSAPFFENLQNVEKKIWRPGDDHCRTWPGLLCGNAYCDFGRDRIASFRVTHT